MRYAVDRHISLEPVFEAFRDRQESERQRAMAPAVSVSATPVAPVKGNEGGGATFSLIEHAAEAAVSLAGAFGRAADSAAAFAVQQAARVGESIGSDIAVAVSTKRPTQGKDVEGIEESTPREESVGPPLDKAPRLQRCQVCTFHHFRSCQACPRCGKEVVAAQGTKSNAEGGAPNAVDPTVHDAASTPSADVPQPVRRKLELGGSTEELGKPSAVASTTSAESDASAASQGQAKAASNGRVQCECSLQFSEAAGVQLTWHVFQSVTG